MADLIIVIYLYYHSRTALELVAEMSWIKLENFNKLSISPWVLQPVLQSSSWSSNYQKTKFLKNGFNSFWWENVSGFRNIRSWSCWWNKYLNRNHFYHETYFCRPCSHVFSQMFYQNYYISFWKFKKINK